MNQITAIETFPMKFERYFDSAEHYFQGWKRWGGDQMFKSLLPQEYQETVWNDIAVELEKRYKTTKGLKIVLRALRVSRRAYDH